MIISMQLTIQELRKRILSSEEVPEDVLRISEDEVGKAEVRQVVQIVPNNFSNNFLDICIIIIIINYLCLLNL